MENIHLFEDMRFEIKMIVTYLILEIQIFRFLLYFWRIRRIKMYFCRFELILNFQHLILCVPNCRQHFFFFIIYSNLNARSSHVSRPKLFCLSLFEWNRKNDGRIFSYMSRKCELYESLINLSFLPGCVDIVSDKSFRRKLSMKDRDTFSILNY